jgi:hypothetical protein
MSGTGLGRKAGPRVVQASGGFLGEPLRLDREQQCLDHARIKLRPRDRAHLLRCQVERQALAVRAVGAHRVPGVSRGDDPRLQWDLLAGEAVGVAAAVPALMVGAHDQADVVHEAADGIEHLLALDGVRLDDLPLAVIELVRLVDDLLGDRDLADVVQ